jgi:AcrR family transcriptional regulator
MEDGWTGSPTPERAAPARRSRAEQAAANREAVLDAAVSVFAEVGYAAASLDRIAEVAGFSKGVVYSRFDSKADLFLAALQRRSDDRAQRHVRELSSARSTGGDPVRALVEELITRSAADPGWRLALIEFRVLAARDEQLRRRYLEAHRESLDRLTEVFAELIDVVPAMAAGVSARTLAFSAISLDLGVALEDLAVHDPPDMDERVLIMLRLLGATDTGGPS